MLVAELGETDVVDEVDGPLRGVTVAHVGHFDPAYSRNRIMAKALQRAGAAVRTVTDERAFVRRTPYLARELARIPSDVVLVGFPGHSEVVLARALSARTGAPVLFDAFVSRYESGEDRGTAPPGTPRARANLLEDRLVCALASRVVCDTAEHADYFASRIGVPRRKLRRVWVGADDDVMRPARFREAAPFRVVVYASFIPLHGLEHVVRAAHVLDRAGEEIRIDVVGSGATEDAIRALASDLRVRNLHFLGRRAYHELPGEMAASDVCLGIFGTSPKAARVIPNKVFDALAVARAVVTADTPAAREVLIHGENAWLCRPGDADDLAAALLALRDDPAARRHIARRGHETFVERFSIDALSRALSTIVLEALDR